MQFVLAELKFCKNTTFGVHKDVQTYRRLENWTRCAQSMPVLVFFNVEAALFVSAKERARFDNLLKHFDGELNAYHAQRRKCWRQRSAGEHTARQHFHASVSFLWCILSLKREKKLNGWDGSNRIWDATRGIILPLRPFPPPWEVIVSHASRVIANEFLPVSFVASKSWTT